MTDRATETPKPEITDQTRPFWDATREGRLVMQKCAACGTVNFPPKPWCIDCGCRDLPWTAVGPGGAVYSWTVSRSVAMNWPGWTGQLPVVMALVDVDGGGRMYGQVIDCAPEDIRTGLRLAVTMVPVGEDVFIPKFRPAA